MKDPHGISIRRQGDVVELKIYATYGGRSETFRGKANVNNKNQMIALFDAARAKGLEIPPPPEERSNWYDG